MRLTPALFGLAASFLLAAPAFAGPVLAPVSFSPEFQASLEDNLGVREGEELREAVTDAVNRALARRGAVAAQGAPLTIEISIVDADPNRPTMQQLAARPGLDYGRSLSIGGAELHAVLRGADGGVISEVSHRRYNYDINEVANFSPTTWSEARRAIRRFAERVADAYMAAQ
jgi:hypothetical protein